MPLAALYNHANETLAAWIVLAPLFVGNLHQSGALHRPSILLEAPQVYRLPAHPRGSLALSDVWQRVIKPLGGIAVGAPGLELIIHWLIASTQIQAEEV